MRPLLSLPLLAVALLVALEVPAQVATVEVFSVDPEQYGRSQEKKSGNYQEGTAQFAIDNIKHILTMSRNFFREKSTVDEKMQPMQNEMKEHPTVQKAKEDPTFTGDMTHPALEDIKEYPAQKGGKQDLAFRVGMRYPNFGEEMGPPAFREEMDAPAFKLPFRVGMRYAFEEEEHPHLQNKRATHN